MSCLRAMSAYVMSRGLFGTFVYELHDLGILEVDEAFSFAVLGDGGKVGILLCEIVEVNVALVVRDLLHVDDSVLSCLPS